MVRMKWDCRLSTGLPPSSRLRGCEARSRTCSERETGTESCVRSSGIITLSAQGPSDGSGWSPPQTRPQKWSITSGSPTGESWFHISPPRGFMPRSLLTGSKGLVHWTSETWWEWSEIAGSPQYFQKWDQRQVISLTKWKLGYTCNIAKPQKYEFALIFVL